MNRARTWMVWGLVAAAAWTAWAGDGAEAPEAAPASAPEVRAGALPDGLPGHPDALPLCPPEGRRNDIYDLLVLLPLFGAGWVLNRAVRHVRNRRRTGPKPPPTPSIR